jgi:hypothetical protein
MLQVSDAVVASGLPPHVAHTAVSALQQQQQQSQVNSVNRISNIYAGASDSGNTATGAAVMSEPMTASDGGNAPVETTFENTDAPAAAAASKGKGKRKRATVTAVATVATTAAGGTAAAATAPAHKPPKPRSSKVSQATLEWRRKHQEQIQESSRKASLLLVRAAEQPTLHHW